MLQLSDPREFFLFKLGEALSMEETNVTMLRERAELASGNELERQLYHHRDETRGQVRNLMQAFAALGYEPKPQPSPVIEGLRTESELAIQRATPELHDLVILDGCVGVEHYEIAVYDGLIALADELDSDDVAALLKENLEQEEHALEQVQKAFGQRAKALAERVTA